MEAVVKQVVSYPSKETNIKQKTTIKLKEVTASQPFQRLSSYAKDNPLYRAMKEFGRIIKSLYILTYFDDVKLRQRIEKQLNRIAANGVIYDPVTSLRTLYCCPLLAFYFIFLILN